MIRSDVRPQKHANLLLLLFAIWASGLTISGFGAGVAIVTDFHGKAAAVSNGNSRDVSTLSEFLPGTKVQLYANAVMVAMYLETGDEYVCKGPAEILFGLKQPTLLSGPKLEKRNTPFRLGQQSTRIKQTGVVQSTFVMRNGRPAGRIRMLTLSGTRTLQAEPEFIWQEVQPGLTYHFEIKDDTGHTLHKAQVAATSFRLPASISVHEGVVYTWSISARFADGRNFSNVGDFSIANQSLRAQAENLRPTNAAPFSSRVAFATWLDQMGLKDEARKYWVLLRAERPQDAAFKTLAGE